MRTPPPCIYQNTKPVVIVPHWVRTKININAISRNDMKHLIDHMTNDDILISNVMSNVINFAVDANITTTVDCGNRLDGYVGTQPNDAVIKSMLSLGKNTIDVLLDLVILTVGKDTMSIVEFSKMYSNAVGFRAFAREQPAALHQYVYTII